MGRTLSAKQVLTIKYRTIAPGGIWADCVGTIGRSGVIFFWGNSGNGKTSAVISFCRELCRLGLRGIYLSKEEGVDLTMQETLRRFNMAECGSRFQIDGRMTIEELDERLSKPRSADFAVVDSFQYTQMSYKQYIAFKERHRNKLLIFVSHADGKRPDGRSATKVMYDAALKIWVEGYKAFSKGRFIGPTGECTIYEEGARRYWGGGKPVKQNDMDLNSQNKVMRAGFMIIRKDDQPQPRIKYKQFGFPDWRTFEKFSTKAERDRRFKELTKDSTIIED